jgi:predicted lipoprotein with Yx(FWY)xxD motif
MRNFRMTIAMVGVGVSVATLGGGLAMAETGVSSTPSAVAATPTGTAQAVTPLGSPALLAITDVATVKTATGTTLHTANVEVGQARETILVNSKGLPLYVYRPDTASMSKVTGELAALWPPLIAKHPTASGSTGVLSTVPTISGRQVTYNGHFLYTFAEDVPLQVSGQNVENFSVATPQITVNHGNASTTKTAPATTPATGRSGY